MNRERLKDNVGKEFRLRPAVRIGSESEDPAPCDDRWRLTGADGFLVLTNTRTNQTLRIGADHVHEFRTPDYLMLKCQVTIRASEVTIEPTPLNKEAVLQVVSTLGHADRMRVSDQARRTTGRRDRNAVPSTGATETNVGVSDTTPPVLAAFEIPLGSVKVGHTSATVSLRAHLLDDLSGVAGPTYRSSPTQVRFRSPSGKQFVDAIFQSGRELVSGTANDGMYESQLRFQRFAEVGTWLLEYFLLVDECGNQDRLTAADVEAMGFPTSIQVAG